MHALFDMGGYGFYVWSSVLLALAVCAWNLLAPVLDRRELLRRLQEDDFEDQDPS